MGTHYKGPAPERRALDAYIKLMRASESVSARLERSLVPRRLSLTQLGILEALWHLGPMCQRDIGRRMLRSAANITSAIDQLEGRRLVRRERNNEDRRFTTVGLTAEGSRAIGQVFPGHVREIVGAMRTLSAAEQEELGRLCRKLGLANRAGEAEAPRAAGGRA